MNPQDKLEAPDEDPGFVPDAQYENPFSDWPEFSERAPGPKKKTRAKKTTLSEGTRI